MRIAAGVCLIAVLMAGAPATAQAQDVSMASLTEAQLQQYLVGDWTLALGFGAGPMSITGLHAGQLSVTGSMVLNYDTLHVTRGHIEGDNVTLNFNAGTLQGKLTNPRHMEGDILFRGDSTSGTAHWFADKVGR
jgi:hypothetical protein